MLVKLKCMVPRTHGVVTAWEPAGAERAGSWIWSGRLSTRVGGLRARTAVLASALLFVGFRPIGILSRSPH